MTASKINPVYQTCQAAFYSVPALERQKDIKKDRKKERKAQFNFLPLHSENQGQT